MDGVLYDSCGGVGNYLSDSICQNLHPTFCGLLIGLCSSGLPVISIGFMYFILPVELIGVSNLDGVLTTSTELDDFID